MFRRRLTYAEARAEEHERYMRANYRTVIELDDGRNYDIRDSLVRHLPKVRIALGLPPLDRPRRRYLEAAERRLALDIKNRLI